MGVAIGTGDLPVRILYSHTHHTGIDSLLGVLHWRELNLAVEPQIAIAGTLADLNFGGSVQDRHT